MYSFSQVPKRRIHVFDLKYDMKPARQHESSVRVRCQWRQTRVIRFCVRLQILYRYDPTMRKLAQEALRGNSGLL